VEEASLLKVCITEALQDIVSCHWIPTELKFTHT